MRESREGHGPVFRGKGGRMDYKEGDVGKEAAK